MAKSKKQKDKWEKVFRSRWFWILVPLLLIPLMTVIMSLGKNNADSFLSIIEIFFMTILPGIIFFPKAFVGGLMEIFSLPYYLWEESSLLLTLAWAVIVGYALFLVKVKVIPKRWLYYLSFFILLVILITSKGCSTIITQLS